jgi:hypothetical protein
MANVAVVSAIWIAANSGEPCGEETSAVEQPCIAGFAREQDRLTNRDEASVLTRDPATLFGQSDTIVAYASSKTMVLIMARHNANALARSTARIGTFASRV